MQVRSLIFMAGFCLLSSGCTMYESGARNLCKAPLAYCQHADECQRRQRHRDWAEAAWEYIESTEPWYDYTDDYEEGFKAGFVDYLESDGSGMPPPLPPRYYWSWRYQTPAGHEAIQNWYAGFRDGSSIAQETGQRELIIVPSSTVFATDSSPSSSPIGGVSRSETTVADLPRVKPASQEPARRLSAMREVQPESLPPPKLLPATYEANTLAVEGGERGVQSVTRPETPALSTSAAGPPSPLESPPRRPWDNEKDNAGHVVQASWDGTNVPSSVPMPNPFPETRTHSPPGIPPAFIDTKEEDEPLPDAPPAISRGSIAPLPSRSLSVAPQRDGWKAEESTRKKWIRWPALLSW